MHSSLLLGTLLVILVFFLATTESGKSKRKGKTEEKFTYGQRSCTWREGRDDKMHGQERGLYINCKKHGNEAKLKCVYVGDPHKDEKCKYSGAEVAFYKCLLKELTKDNVSPCHPQEIHCDWKGCEGIGFVRRNQY